MTFKPYIIVASCAAFACQAILAITLEEAKEFYNAGSYDLAAETLCEAASHEPKNGQLNQMAGIAMYNIGEYGRAAHFLKLGLNESNLYLAQIAMREYRFNEAETYLDRYENGFRKNKRGPKVVREEAEDIREQIERGRTMLDRVEKIEVIDSIDVDRDSFFEAFRLSPSSGALVSPDFLPRGLVAADPSVVHVSERGDNIFWATVDEDQNYRIASSSLLADNSWEPATIYGLHLNEGGEANYPFMMSDGVTLYFANTGENSLGGYDIFITRLDGNDFLQPQNIGMPYNSYANDYMMAIDEETGVGWWATDRNAAPDRLTIYLFKPSDLRVNYPVDHPDLPSLALLRRFRDTWAEGADYTTLLNAVKSVKPREHSQASAPLRLNIPGKGVVTSPEQLSTAEGRRLATEYVKLATRFAATQKRLDALRRSYAGGKTAVADDILMLEQEVEQMRSQMRSAANDVITAETSE